MDELLTFSENELWTVKEVARRYKVDEATIRNWARGGLLPVVPLPHRNNQKRTTYRFRAATVVALLATETLLTA